MKLENEGAVYWINVALSLVIGCVFIYAGVLKIPNPLQFADNVASYEILPNALVSPFALSLPFLEILAGLLLVTGIQWRVGALAISALAAVFCFAIVYALARGIVIDCGCFGSDGIPSKTQMWLDLGRDILLFIGALVVYIIGSLPVREKS